MSKILFPELERENIKQRDFSLVKKVLNGDSSAFAALMMHYKNRIFIFGKTFFKNETDAEDFVQDVFTKVYTYLESFKGKSMFSTWLMKIAYTTAINSSKRRKEYLPIADEESLPDIANQSPEEVQLRKTARSAIREAVLQLPEKYAICVDMYFSYNIPYSEISEITGFPVNTIKSHIFRAKKLLKSMLEDLYEK